MVGLGAIESERDFQFRQRVLLIRESGDDSLVRESRATSTWSVRVRETAAQGMQRWAFIILDVEDWRRRKPLGLHVCDM